MVRFVLGTKGNTSDAKSLTEVSEIFLKSLIDDPAPAAQTGKQGIERHNTPGLTLQSEDSGKAVGAGAVSLRNKGFELHQMVEHKKDSKEVPRMSLGGP